MRLTILLTLSIWLLKPLNGLVSFFEFVALIAYTPDLIDLDSTSPFYWIFAVLIGLYAVTLLLWAVWIVGSDNYHTHFFPYAFAYPPLRIAVLVGLYFKLLPSGELGLVWFDLAGMLIAFMALFLVAIRAYGYQEKPEKKAIIEQEEGVACA